MKIFTLKHYLVSCLVVASSITTGVGCFLFVGGQNIPLGMTLSIFGWITNGIILGLLLLYVDIINNSKTQ